VVGVGTGGTEACVTGGDLFRSRWGRQPQRELSCEGNAEYGGAAEESERLIVAMTLGESREQQRGRSRRGGI
jgi:hypothetical protein